LIRRAAPEIVSSHRVLDMGTGSGNVGAAIHILTGAHVHATDKNPMAVQNARATFARLGLSAHLDAWVSDGLENVAGPYDRILMNCPYNRPDKKPEDPFEPDLHDPQGQVIQRILARLPQVLAPGGMAFFMNNDLIRQWLPPGFVMKEGPRNIQTITPAN
jgi:methylase of polypeptide subunit release factors